MSYSCKEFFTNHVLPILGALISNKEIDSNVSKQELFDEKVQEFLKLGAEELEGAYEFERKRRDKIIERASGYITGITIAITFSVAIIAFLNSNYRFYYEGQFEIITIRIAVLLVAVWLGCATVAAARILGPARSYDMSLQQRKKLNECKDRNRFMVRVILLNQSENLKIANYLNAASNSMRNSVITIVAVLIILAIVI